MQANLDRLTDLTAELRRQLKPLGKQAEIARKAQAVQSELRDSRLRLFADDLVTQRTTCRGRGRRERRTRAPRRGRADASRWHRPSRSSWRNACRGRAAAGRRTGHLVQALGPGRTAARHRSACGGTGTAPLRRGRRLAAGATPRSWTKKPSTPPSARRNSPRRSARPAAAGGHVQRRDAGKRQAAERAHMAAVRAIADRREGLAKLTGQVEALRSKNGATSDEIDRLTVGIDEASERAEIAMEELEQPGPRRGVEESDDAGLQDQHDRAVARTTRRRRAWRNWSRPNAPRSATSRRRGQGRRVSMGQRKDGAGALLGAPTSCPACSARSPHCSPSTPGTRSRSPRRSDRSPTRSPVAGGEQALRRTEVLEGQRFRPRGHPARR